MNNFAFTLLGAGLTNISSGSWKSGSWMMIFGTALIIVHYGVQQARTWPK